MVSRYLLIDLFLGSRRDALERLLYKPSIILLLHVLSGFAVFFFVVFPNLVPSVFLLETFRCFP